MTAPTRDVQAAVEQILVVAKDPNEDFRSEVDAILAALVAEKDREIQEQDETMQRMEGTIVGLTVRAEQAEAALEKCRVRCEEQRADMVTISTAGGQVADAFKRAEAALAQARDELEILRAVAKRHNQSPGFGECVCEHHVKWRALSGSTDEMVKE